MTSKPLNGRVALVTGGTRGIGLAIARLLVEEGARVFVTGRDAAAIDILAGETNIVGIRADASRLEDIERVFAQIETEAGRLDILVANAGGGRFKALPDITETHFDETFALNVKGVLFTVQRALPVLRDGASVVLIASVTGRKGTPAFSVYSASKAAVRALARNWMLDLKGRGIRVNVISPGPTDTPGLVALAGDAAGAERIRAHLASTIPLGRLGTAQEVAQAALFLASDRSSFINGVDLAVDGGVSEI